MLVKHDENTTGRDWVVGDIHGQLDLLDAELARVGFDRSKDRLFSVGDLIDRGSQSYDCLSLAFESWFYGVRGNHEVMARDALESMSDHAVMHWMQNGGSWALAEDFKDVRQILGEALRHLPLAREVSVAGKRIGIIHAEAPWDWQLLDLNPHAWSEEAVWSRRRISSGDTTPIEGIDAVVVGHTIVETPCWFGNVHYIDTGAFTPEGRLTLIPLAEIAAGTPD